MQKIFLLALSSALFFFSALAIANEDPVIKAEEARNHIGQVRVVCGSVTRVIDKEYGLFIQLGGHYVEDRNGRNTLRPDFTAVVWRESIADVEISPELAHQNGDEICFSGEIRAYRSPAIYHYHDVIPQVTLRTPDQWFIKPTSAGE